MIILQVTHYFGHSKITLNDLRLQASSNIPFVGVAAAALASADGTNDTGD